MPFQRRILHLPVSPDAEPVQIDDLAVQGCWFELHRRGGCGAGEIVLKDSFRDRDRIRVDDWIAMESEPGTRWYLGRVQERRAVSPAGVTCRLEGMSVELGEVYAGGFSRAAADGVPPHRFGESNLFPDDPDAFDETVDSAGSPEFTVRQLLDRYVVGRTHIIIDPALIEASSTGGTVQSMKLRGEESVRSVIKELGVRAGQASWGVGADGKFFFLQPRDDAVATYTEGVDLTRLEETTDRELIFNRLTLTGGYLYQPASGLTGQYNVSRWRGHYLHKGSRARHGDRRIRVWVPWIRTAADSRAFVTEFFRDYAEPTSRYTIEVVAQSALPLPWDGAIRLMDSQGEEICVSRFDTVRVQFDRTLRFRLELGAEDPRVHWPEPEHDERWEIPRSRGSGDGGDEIDIDPPNSDDNESETNQSELEGTTTSDSSGALSANTGNTTSGDSTATTGTTGHTQSTGTSEVSSDQSQQTSFGSSSLISSDGSDSSGSGMAGSTVSGQTSSDTDSGSVSSEAMSSGVSGTSSELSGLDSQTGSTGASEPGSSGGSSGHSSVVSSGANSSAGVSSLDGSSGLSGGTSELDSGLSSNLGSETDASINHSGASAGSNSGGTAETGATDSGGATESHVTDETDFGPTSTPTATDTGEGATDSTQQGSFG